MDRKRDVISAKEAAKRLECNISTVYAGMDQGKIPFIQLGTRRIIPLRAFERLLETGQLPPAAPELTEEGIRQIARQTVREVFNIQRGILGDMAQEEAPKPGQFRLLRNNE